MENLQKNSKLAHFHYIETDGFHGVVRKGFDGGDFLFKQIARVLVGDFNREGAFEKVSSSVFADVRRFEYKGRWYYLKVFLRRKWVDGLKAAMLGSRAYRALIGHEMLAEQGFGQPKLVLMGKKGSCNFVVTEEARSDGTLRECLKRLTEEARSCSSYKRKRRFLAELGREIGRLHGMGISHGDLRCGNILVGELAGETRTFHYLDNERTVRYQRMGAHKRAKNLVQLNMVERHLASRTDRIRFFREYVKLNPVVKEREKYWLRRVIEKTNWRHGERAKRKGVSVN